MAMVLPENEKRKNNFMPNLPRPHSDRIATLESVTRDIDALSGRLEKAIGQMIKHHELILASHIIAFLFELSGTALAYCGMLRLGARLPASGVALADSERYQTWWFHHEGFGFSLLSFAILGQCLVVLLESHGLRKAGKTLSRK